MIQKVRVYIREISEEYDIPLPSYTEGITNKKVLAEKRSAYSLLLYAAKKEYGIDINISKLTKTKNGKPVYPGLHFSLSHSEGLCAVALSASEVGLDIEKRITGERADRIKKRILHPAEDPDTDVTELWTKKEAIFKLKGDRAFVGSEIDTAAYHTFTRKIGQDMSYTFTAAAENELEVITTIM